MADRVDKATRRRLNMLVSAEVQRMVARCRVALDAASDAETIRTALHVTAALRAEADAGGRIVVLRTDGSSEELWSTA